VSLCICVFSVFLVFSCISKKQKVSYWLHNSLQAKRPLGDDRRRLPEQESRAPIIFRFNFYIILSEATIGKVYPPILPKCKEKVQKKAFLKVDHLAQKPAQNGCFLQETRFITLHKHPSFVQKVP